MAVARLRLISLLLFATSALLFAAGMYIYGESNVRPVSLPWPSQGMSVKAPFSLATGGPFHLLVTVPAKSRPDGSDIVLSGAPQCMRVTISAISGEMLQKVVLGFRSAGTYTHGQVAFFESEPFAMRRGAHFIEVEDCGGSPGFNAGILELSRDGIPTDAYLAHAFVRGLAWCTFALGAFVALWSAVRRRSMDPGSSPG